jgi:hypothetical protein
MSEINCQRNLHHHDPIQAIQKEATNVLSSDSDSDTNNNNNSCEAKKRLKSTQADESENLTTGGLLNNDFMPIIKEINNGKKSEFHDDLLNAAVAATRNFSRSPSPSNELKRLHRVVFTGGPCAGKNTFFFIKQTFNVTI